MDEQQTTDAATGEPTICYHHYAFTFDPRQIGTKFNDVRFVLVAGCARRAEAQARYLEANSELGQVEKLTRDESRFTLFKVGPALIGDHGMGAASMSIAVHELAIMCREADVLKLITLIRFGTCGGLGVEPGTVCVTQRSLDPLMHDYVELRICAKIVRRPCIVDAETSALLVQVGQEMAENDAADRWQVVAGATVAANDFYEEQARTNGAICEHSAADKARYLKSLRAGGVINIEMESNYLVAMCHKLGVSFGIICVALTDRLAHDEIKLSHDKIAACIERLFRLNLSFIKRKLQLAE